MFFVVSTSLVSTPPPNLSPFLTLSQVNGAPMLVLGANLIPLDQFDGRASADAHYMHVRSAAEAHYTMLRHWGGGIFQYDVVFDAMDEFGILGYQDLMYAQQVGSGGLNTCMQWK